ncbi:uncharacterized protein MYCFIDRAFT_177723 [Pseudocercospora fijiensis CIRAD86]|uniref:Uncharacterized protein n=1 Tax=Pseudocercospora fijiensis (strain CIRAD86) TaxID=383855 RepID=M3ANK6_PSEFD|nr:uncharacterized protein MYCFIDRAFT_177723 [Pseudocercospora fijiensis CIRAD86]EME79052.1 hypothetical protein MYCFIDRAFT_177723 [Pseudocercospora fijiensis CIRAD86]
MARGHGLRTTGALVQNGSLVVSMTAESASQSRLTLPVTTVSGNRRSIPSQHHQAGSPPLKMTLVLRTSTPSFRNQENIRVQECTEAFQKISALHKQKEEYIKQLAHSEGILNERQRLLDDDDDDDDETIESMQEDLNEHESLVSRHLKNNLALQAGYHEYILALLMRDVDSKWLRQRRRSLRAAFHAAEDVHGLILKRCRYHPYGKERRVRVGKRRGKVERNRNNHHAEMSIVPFGQFHEFMLAEFGHERKHWLAIDRCVPEVRIPSHSHSAVFKVAELDGVKAHLPSDMENPLREGTAV